MKSERNTQKLKRRLKGYYKFYRESFLLLSENTISTEQFSLYVVLEALTDWDDRHIENYGYVECTHQSLARVLGWKTGTTVTKHLKKLLIIGLVLKDELGRIKVVSYDDWKSRTSAENNLVNAEIQPREAYLLVNSAEIEVNYSQNDKIPLVSSNGSLGLFPQESSLTKEDINWINSNVLPLNDTGADDRLVEEAVEIFTSP